MKNWEQEDKRRAAEVLETAADVLATRGWTKGALYRHGGETGASYCALGAIRRARRLLSAREEHAHMARRALIFVLVLGGYMGIESFNDSVAKEVGDVTDKLLEAAKNLRNEAHIELGGRPD